MDKERSAAAEIEVKRYLNDHHILCDYDWDKRDVRMSWGGLWKKKLVFYRGMLCMTSPNEWFNGIMRDLGFPKVTWVNRGRTKGDTPNVVILQFQEGVIVPMAVDNEVKMEKFLEQYEKNYVSWRTYKIIETAKSELKRLRGAP
ncbi:hypothetical protein HWB92_gp165 [Serratia phage vB_SmaA_3M]|uniref:Uncharacterized protein n=1 Tax=Serratia phage vB_SmaA_3M TaxID=2419930 RepID=A0A3G2YSC6_9CAUD|nr:hypothetical protein HWB92_gp165 [Serratia phage vB_SmaA_3M]AYP28423.1 hypothetical protein 3M_167 [Serratia phage vB_SmaA_3M]